MENDPNWHGRAPNKEQLQIALEELERKQKHHLLLHAMRRKGVLR